MEPGNASRIRSLSRHRIATRIPPAAPTYLDEGDFFAEKSFERMLIMERTKTDRFGKPFMLMVLNVGRLLKDGRKKRGSALHDLTVLLHESTRKLDIKGWYMRDALIGVIFTDVNRKNGDLVSGKLTGRFRCRFNAYRGIQSAMTCLFYPESRPTAAATG